MNNLILIIGEECLIAAENVNGIKPKIRAAAKSASNAWVTGDKDLQVRGYLIGLMKIFPADTEEGQTIKQELEFLTDRITRVEFEPFGILQIWQEALENLAWSAQIYKRTFSRF